MTHTAIKTGLIALTMAFGIGAAQADDAGQNEVAVFLTIKTQDGQRDALVELWDAHLKTQAATNPDHVSYVFAVDMQDPNTAYISEVYATQAAFQANTQSEWFAAYMTKVGPLLAGESAFAMASPHWVK